MLKVAVVAFALAISGAMLWIAHEDANFANCRTRRWSSGRREAALQLLQATNH
jgi:hypothetical protein